VFVLVWAARLLAVDVGMGVDMVAMAVLMLVLGIEMLMLAVTMPAVRPLVRPAGAELLRTAPAEAKDGEVREARLVTEAAPDRRPDRVELLGVHAGDPSATLAGDVFAVGAADDGVEPGPVSDVNVPDEPQPLELDEVPVHGSHVHRRRGTAHLASQVLGGGRTVGGKQGFQDHPAGGGDPMSGFAQGAQSLIEFLDPDRRSKWGIAHGTDVSPRAP
jgi:hypothetical protein